MPSMSPTTDTTFVVSFAVMILVEFTAIRPVHPILTDHLRLLLVHVDTNTLKQ